MRHIYVTKNKQSNNLEPTYSTIQSAIDSIPLNSEQETIIHISSGVYEEKITIQIPNIQLLGEGTDSTIIRFHDAAYDCMNDGTKRGTFRSYTLFIDTNDFVAKNLTIQNTAGFGHDVGQAIAVYADGDRILFDHCLFDGNQDTLFTGPLPPTPYEPNGFVGPKEFAPRMNGRQYYRACKIIGNIDYIFGSATAYFEDCILYTRYSGKSIPSGYVTAASTPLGQDYGYVFFHCQFTGDCPPNSVYLGRPWRDDAKTVMIDCSYDDCIHSDAFHDWGKEKARSSSYYALYHTVDPNFLLQRFSFDQTFVHILNEEDLSQYSKDQVFSDWIPSKDNSPTS